MSPEETLQVKQLQAILTTMQVTLDAITDAVVWIGENRLVQWCNSSFELLVNQPRDRILNSSLQNLLPLLQAKVAIAPDSYPDAQLLDGVYEVTEYQLQKGNDFLVLQISGTCLAQPQTGQIAILTIRDLTQTRRLESEYTRAVQEKEASASMLRTTLESTADGIAVIDWQGNVPVYNQKVIGLWSLPEYLLLPGRGEERLRLIAEQTKDPEGFVAKVREIVFQHPEETVLDLVELKDGRVFERYSHPQRLGNQVIGRVWSFRDITERQRTQEALQQSELQYRSIFEAIRDGLFISDIDTETVIEVNPAACQMHGYSYEEFIALHPSAYIHPDFHSVLQAFFETMKTGQEFNAQAVDVRKDGTLIDVEVKGTICTYNGKPHILAVVRDISDRKQAEAALRASEAQYRDVVETANCIILRWDNHGNVTFLNNYGQRFFGFDFEEIVGRNVVGTIVPETETSGRDLQALMVDICQNPENYLFNENENIRKNGERVWIVWANKPILDEQGNLIEILSIGTDTTDRKRVEEALRRSEERLRLALDAGQAGVWDWDIVNNQIVWSERIYEFHGLVGESFNGQVEDFAELIYPEDRGLVTNAIQTAIEQKTPYQIEFRAIQPSGAVRWLLTNGRVLYDEIGNPQRMLGATIDLTARKQAEEALQRSEVKYRHLFENSQVGILRARWQDGLILDANQRSADILGFSSPIELIGKHFTTEFYVNLDDRTNLIAELEQYGEIRDFEVPVRRLDGSIAWMLLSSRLNLEESCIVSVFTDISDRKRREVALNLIVEGTAAKTGDEFFNSCVRYLAEVLQVRYALVTKFINSAKTKVRTLAVWRNGMLGENFEYDLQGTPCEYALQGQPCYYPQGVQSLFPNDADLVNLSAESYLGVPLMNSSGDILGHFAVIDVKPMESDPGRELILRIFAARAGAELERKQAQEALERRAEAESLLSSISRQFIDQDINTAINFTLGAIAQFLNTERCCIFEHSNDQNRVYLFHEWRATNLPSSNLAGGGPVVIFPRLVQIMNNSAFQISCVGELPPDAPERILLESQSIQSILAVPMIHSHQVVGFICGDVVNFSKQWSQEDINFLNLVGELIAIARARHQAEEALRVAKDAAEAANRAKSAFLANMSHELRTPLNAILGFAQLMERDTALTINQRASLATINRSGEHLLNLINDVLEMSKIEAGRIILHPEPFDLYLLLQNLQEMFRVRSQTKQLFLEFEIAPDLPQYINTDEGKLRQVLINLLGNAVKFTQTGGVTLRATIGARGWGLGTRKRKRGVGDWGRVGENSSPHPRIFVPSFQSRQTTQRREPSEDQSLPPHRRPEGGFSQSGANTNGTRGGASGDFSLQAARSPIPNPQFLIFEVEDTGCGIAPEEIKNLFKPFVQTMSGIETHEGTGLGLTISRQFVNLMGGDIEVSSILGQGSTFRFGVQVTLADSGDVTPQFNHGRVLKIAPEQPNYRILVVDDRKENRDFIMQLLSSVGFEVEAAINGQEAVQRWQTWQPQLVFMDMHMPVMSGYEATREIRDREKGGAEEQRENLFASRIRTVIIALTASAFEEQKATILAAGCDDLVRKPFREQVLFEKIAQHLGVRYLYAQQPEAMQAQENYSQASPEIQFSQLSAIMSAQWLAQLRQAALEVDGDRILQLVEQIPETHSVLAEGMTDLVRRFCFDEILELTGNLQP
ncbi:MAG: PAS domain S-box protein [Chlorogloeopsis fritschii C42_A2020_084]|uniref:PAS domain S-box protein n=1 Tax=Chlorogloeopsis fritschii TaxID=1124 RepID=UPI0019E9B00D|nr:PAS domain S-box protein [Chlorogloeopsis fritschii]MBF2008215.1 PAS domain S-box protein [Chlorogloeopsis fritschii C42_A2020_084]